MKKNLFRREASDCLRYLFSPSSKMSLYSTYIHGSIFNETEVVRNRLAQFFVTTVVQQLFNVTSNLKYLIKP
jgi:hypothetical protein